MAKVDFNGEGQELERITAKKNYASSMQSHKMGSCAMFNELHKYMGENFYPDLINEVDGNYAVEQYPVLAFQDVKLEDTSDYEQRYIGLYTVGADKGDKGYFGFNDPRVKDKAIRLEGTDHINGVGFNYPWRVNGVRNIRYNHDKEALCIVTGEDKTKWTAILEQSHCGTAETEAEIEAYLEEKFMPIYELTYNNNPLLVGTSMSIETINADVDAFGSLRRTDGRPYSYCEFWIDGEYDVYYLNQERNRYEKNGLNLYNVLSDEDKARVDAASTLDEKNEIFIKHRVNAFKEVAENYICIDDALFLIVFCLVVVASDNFEKNMYPYIMDFLLRFFNDDLDSIFSTDNQAQDTKKYSAELHDFTDDTMSAYVFKGEDNALFNLIEMAYPDRLMKMGKDMLQSMYDLSKKGTKTLDRLNGYYDQTFFDKAQEYFPISAYNNDSEVSYLEAWNDKDYVASVDIHPLAQSLGNHYTTEKRFVNLRNVYLMSKFGFGGFSSYEDNSLGVISVRTQKPVGFTLTPAIDMYPTILGGQAQVSKSERRIKAGESVTLAAVGGGNTNVYIVAADYLTDIGDLKDLSIDPSSDVSLNVSSKRLRWLKLGDEDAAAVTSYLSGVNIQKCDSLEIIDARNLVSLKGDVDLTNCPRLYAALFKGTSTKKINIPVGSKIEILTLPDTVTTLVLNKLQNLTEEGLDFGTLGQLAYLRLESNKKLDGWELMKTAQQNSDQLTHIRVIGFYKLGDSNDLNLIMQLTNGEYHGIDAEGNADNTGYPIIEGHLHIAGSASQANLDFLKGKFPALVLTADQIVNYFKFADPEVSRIVAENWGDGTGTTVEQIEAITNINKRFRYNTLIETFDEFEKFKNFSPNNSDRDAFDGCTSLKTIKIPKQITYIPSSFFSNAINLEININDCFDNITKIESYAFASTKIYGILNSSSITIIDVRAFYKTNISGDIYLPNLQSLGIAAFEQCKNIERVLSLGNITTIGGGGGYGGTFEGCDNLKEIIIPDSVTTVGTFVMRHNPSLKKIEFGSNITSIGHRAIENNKSLETVIIKAPVPPTVDWSVYNNNNNCTFYVPDASVEAYKNASNWNEHPDRIQSIFYYLGYIDFVDPVVRDICVANFDTDGDGVVSMEEAAAVTDMSTFLNSVVSRSIKTFNEFKYFTGITTFKLGGSSSYYDLEEITLPSSIISMPRMSIYGKFNKLKSFTIPKNVVNIGSEVLYFTAPGLKMVIMENDTPINSDFVLSGYNNEWVEIVLKGDKENLSTKGGCLYSKDGKTLYATPHGVETIPLDGVETIKQIISAKITNFIIPETVLSITKIKTYTSSFDVVFNGNTTIEGDFIADTYCRSITINGNCYFANRALRHASRLNRLIITYDKNVLVINGNIEINSGAIANGTGYIYVPDNLVEDYKVAANWSTYASQIKPLSEYVEE